MTLRSSRTLPGQEYSASARKASGVRCSAGLPQTLTGPHQKMVGQFGQVLRVFAKRRHLHLRMRATCNAISAVRCIGDATSAHLGISHQRCMHVHGTVWLDGLPGQREQFVSTVTRSAEVL